MQILALLYANSVAMTTPAAWTTRARPSVGRPAFHDRSVEQPLGARHRQQRGDAHGAGRFAEDGHLAGVPAQGPDVLLHPFQRSDLIEETQVSNAIAQVEEALGAHSVIDGHARHAVAGEPAAVLEG